MSQKPPPAAVISVIGALGLAAVTWVLLGRAADVGIERLDRIDRMQKVCAERYTYALNRLDTLRVDRSAIPDTIDAKSSSRIDRCGYFRQEGVKRELPNARELNGEALPRGLR